MEGIILTPGQDELRYMIRKWYKEGLTKSKPYFSYSGAAGTGKTTVVRALVSDLGLKDNEYICVAYTGKAALQLIRNELPAKTIHSLIYNVWVEQTKVMDEDGNVKPKLKLKISLKESLDPELKLIVVDEATMVNDQMRDEILSFGIPTIFIGDMNQLPPVFGISSVMMNPDYILTQIMRQKEGDPIIQLSQMILQGRALIPGEYGLSRVLTYLDMGENIVRDYDQIICAKNKTREAINNLIRYDIIGRKDANPVIGDKIICRQNNWDKEVDGIFLTNGLVGFITDVDRSRSRRGYTMIGFRPDFMDTSFEDLQMDIKYLNLDFDLRSQYGISSYEKFEYGYAITTHLAQGAQWPRVLFLDEKFYDAETTQKLRYTAITRASESIDIVVRNPYAHFMRG